MDWSELPKDLVQKIAGCFETETDVIRFRAICSAWRSFTVGFSCTRLMNPCFPSFRNGSWHRGLCCTLAKRTVYRVESPERTEPGFWLLKTERTNRGTLRLLNIVSNHEMGETLLPRLFNSLDFRVSEVCSFYTLQYVNRAGTVERNVDYAIKVVVSGDVKNDQYVVTAIDFDHSLWCIKAGDEKWTRANDEWPMIGRILDVVNFKGRIYLMNDLGETWVFDPSKYELTRIINSVNSDGWKRHLVELYKGELCLVEEVMGVYGDGLDESKAPKFSVRILSMKIKISMLHTQSAQWVEAKEVANQIIILGDDWSFSVLGDEGCNGTRVYFSNQHIRMETEDDEDDDDEDDGGDTVDCSSETHAGWFIPSEQTRLKFKALNGHTTGVCDFRTRKSGSLLMLPEFSDIFWPPPSWLTHR